MTKGKTSVLRLQVSVEAKPYGKSQLVLVHFEIWLLKLQQKTFFLKIEVCGKVSDF